MVAALQTICDEQRDPLPRQRLRRPRRPERPAANCRDSSHFEEALPPNGGAATTADGGAGGARATPVVPQKTDDE
jgi:hypothetical protein